MMNKYKLAISEQKLKTFLQLKGKALESFLKSLKYDEIASIIVLPELLSSFNEYSKNTEKLFEYLNDALTKLVPALLSESEIIWQLPLSIIGNLSERDLLINLNNLHVELMADDEIHRREHLSQAGMQWRTQEMIAPPPLLASRLPEAGAVNEYAFQSQERFIRGVLVNEQEHTIAQGFAGIGKTTMVGLLINALRAKHNAIPLYLTKNTYQVEVFRRKGLKVGAMSFNSAVSREFGRTLDYLVQSTNSNISSSYFNFKPLGYMDSLKVYQCALRTLYSYCLSASTYISDKHLPYFITGNSTQHIANAQIIWSELMKLDPSVPLKLEWFHVMKMVSLRRSGFTKLKASHIIVDEGHDLHPALQLIVNDTQTPVIVLKDDMQNVQAKKYFHTPSHRTVEIEQSVRQGKAIERLIQALTSTKYYSFHSVFEGSSKKETAIEYYQNNYDFPDRKATILTGSVFILLSVLFKLENRALSYSILPPSLQTLSGFINDAMHLNNYEPYKTKGFLFTGVKTWDDFFGKNFRFQANSNLLSFLKNNKRLETLQATLNSLPSLDDTEFDLTYILGIVDHAKSIEFKNVFLCQDLFWNVKSESLARHQSNINRLYIGLTRATDTIYLPYDSMEMITELMSHEVHLIQQ